MSISIILYRVSQAEKIEDLPDLEKQLEDAIDQYIDLYKMYHDLALIFSNSLHPYANSRAIEYRIIFGNPHRLNVGANEIGGFIPSSQISEINKWIKDNRLDTPTGFYKMVQDLSPEVINELNDTGSAAKEDLYLYVKELTALYNAAEQGNNSIVICAG